MAHVQRPVLCLLVLVAACGIDPPETGSTEAALDGDNWTTIEDNDYNHHGAVNRGVAVDPSGKVWVIGDRTEANGTNTWIVKLGDGNGTWNLDNAYRYPGSTLDSSAYAIAIGPVAGITTAFVVGNATDSADHDHWIVRKTVDGVKWTTVDDYRPTGTDAYASAVAIDNTGVVYVAGSTENNNLNSTWKVRYSTDGGFNWSESDTLSGAPGAGAGANGLCQQNGTVFATGYKYASGLSAHWITRMTSDHGANWHESDELVVPASLASANNCGASGQRVYVAGFYFSTNDYHWLVRSSPNGTSGSWTSVDDQGPVFGNGATSVRTEANGDAFALGTYGLGNGTGTWHVRKSINAGGAWTDSDDLDLGNGGTALMFKQSPVTGSGFAVGWSKDANGISHAIVRKL